MLPCRPLVARTGAPDRIWINNGPTCVQTFCLVFNVDGDGGAEGPTLMSTLTNGQLVTDRILRRSQSSSMVLRHFMHDTGLLSCRGDHWSQYGYYYYTSAAVLHGRRRTAEKRTFP